MSVEAERGRAAGPRAFLQTGPGLAGGQNGVREKGGAVDMLKRSSGGVSKQQAGSRSSRETKHFFLPTSSPAPYHNRCCHSPHAPQRRQQLTPVSSHLDPSSCSSSSSSSSSRYPPTFLARFRLLLSCLPACLPHHSFELYVSSCGAVS